MARRKAPVIWFEIPVTNFDKAISFYRTLFGWEFEEASNPSQEYRMIDAGDHSINGGLALRKPGEESRGVGPIFYIQVNDIEMTILRSRKLGATLERPPTFLSREAGMVASIRDPDGNVIGLWASE
jgi:predicted enzyme related to lactoylglutathione lyase